MTFNDAKQLQAHLDATREQRERLTADALLAINMMARDGADPLNVALAFTAAAASVMRDLVKPEHVAELLRQMADSADRIPDRPADRAN